MNLAVRCLRSSLLLAIAGAFVACSSPVPTTGTLTGTVTLTGATDASGTIVSAGGQVAATGADGHFLLSNLAPGAVQVAASHQGYVTQQQSVTVTAGQQAKADLTLKPVIPAPVLNSLVANPPVVAPGGTVQLTADVSAAASDTLTYTWTVPAGWTQSGTGASIALQAPAQYGQSALIGLKVTDAQGLSVEGHVTASTQALGGVSISSLTAVPPQVAPGGHIQLEVLASDLSGAALTYQWTAPAGWSFQEASTTQGAVLVAPATYSTFGTVSVTVTGAAGATATAQAVVGTLADRAPVIQSLLALDPLPVLPGSSVRVAVTAADPDGDAMTYTWTAADPSWTITGTGATVSITAPAAANNATTQLTVVVSDGAGGTASGTIAVASSGCPANKRNCDGVAANGCEANLYDSTSCGACGNSCATGTYCGAQTACIPLGTSCEAIREAGNSKGDGIYWIQPLGATAPYAAWCDMTTDGGGWTAFYSGLNGEPNQFAHFYMKTRVCPDPASQCLQPMPASTAHSVQIQATCGASKVAFFGNDSTYDYFAGGGFDNWSTMTRPVSLDGTNDNALATQFYLGNNNTYSGWIITGDNEDGASTFASSVEDAEYNYCNGVPDRSSPIRLMYRQQVDHLQVDIAPAIAMDSGTFTVTVTAVDSQNQAVPEYVGTVHFSSADASLALPADYTFTADDVGTHVFTFTTPVSGQYPITVTDTAHATLTATVTAYVGVQQLAVQLPRAVSPNLPFNFVVQALDANKQPVPGYAGTVHFTLSDEAATAPSDYTFQTSDNGSATISATLVTVGSQTITVTDTSHSAWTATSTVTVTTAPGTANNPATSCLQIHNADSTLGDGVYTLTDGTNTYNAYCDMTTAGGGWTLALKSDGHSTRFGYDATYWTSTQLYSPTAGDQDTTEAKLVSFNVISGTNVLVKLQEEETQSTTVQTQVVPMPQQETLLALFSGNIYHATQLGRAAWKALLPGSSLQLYCNQEGFNVHVGGMKQRIGILGNEQNDCSSPDSRLGVGGSGASCFGDGSISDGNVAGCGGDLGDISMYAFAWVFVR